MRQTLQTLDQREWVTKTLIKIAKKGEKAFTGEQMVAEVFTVSETEGEDLIEVLRCVGASSIALPPEIISAPASIRYFLGSDNGTDVGAFLDNRCVGVYAGSCLYVLPEYRGRGYGAALCVGAALVRGGSVTGDWQLHGYCAAGLSTHQAALEKIRAFVRSQERHRPPSPLFSDWQQINESGLLYSEQGKLFWLNGRTYDQRSAEHNGLTGAGAGLRNIIRQQEAGEPTP